MPRLIDADELKKQTYPFPCAIGVEYAVTLRAINDAPTIDVAAELAAAKAEIERMRPAYEQCNGCEIVCAKKEIKRHWGEMEQLRLENAWLNDLIDVAKIHIDGLQERLYKAEHDRDRYKRRIEAVQGENQELRSALARTWFAYVNKDPDDPHEFEVEAVRRAEGLIGDWKTVMTSEFGEG